MLINHLKIINTFKLKYFKEHMVINLLINQLQVMVYYVKLLYYFK